VAIGVGSSHPFCQNMVAGHPKFFVSDYFFVKKKKV